MSNATPELEKMANGHPIAINTLTGPECRYRALVLATGSSHVDAIRAALRARGVEPFELDEVAPQGRTILELLRDSITEADLVIAVMNGEQAEPRAQAVAHPFDPSPDIRFGLGYAAALGKAILTLVRPGDTAPIAGIPAFPFSSNNPDALDFWLEVLLYSPRPERTEPRESIQKTTPLGSLTDTWSRQVQQGHRLHKEELRRVVREVFRKSGVEGVYDPSETPDPSGRADMVIWSDDFEPWLGDLILVNVVDPLQSPAELDETRAKLAHVLESTHSKWGLLIDQGAISEAIKQTSRSPRILEFSLERMLESLRESSLGEFLLELRNARIHRKD